MSDADQAKRIARAARRRSQPQAWPIRAYALGSEPALDPLDSSTAEGRLAQVWPLSLAAWAMTGKPMPDYDRTTMPGKVLRRVMTE